MSDMSLETLLASSLATGGGGGGSYDDTELRRRVTTLEGEVNSIDTQKLEELADIKSIGNGLDLDANGELNATGGSGSTDWNDITNKPTDLVEDADYVHTDNNFTTADKDKLAGLSNYDDTALQGEVDALDASLVALTQTVATAQGDITNLENTKVDKVDGLGLSQNSFTDAEKTKLTSLENYDDTALAERVTANETAIADRYTKSETDTLLDGYAETVELTQAEYDALTETEKKNGKIYFITDGQGGGTAYQAGEGVDIANDVISVKDEFVKWNVARPDASKSTLTSYKKYSGDDARGLFQISTREGVAPENKVGDMDINVWVQAGTNKISKLDFFYCDADGEAMRLTNSIIIEDTGWQNGNGIRYRKKNGLLFVAYGDYTPSENIPAGATHTMDTLPQEYRPSTRVLGVIMSGNEKVNASVETNGEVNIGGFTNVVTAGTIVPLRGQLIAIM